MKHWHHFMSEVMYPTKWIVLLPCFSNSSFTCLIRNTKYLLFRKSGEINTQRLLNTTMYTSYLYLIMCSPPSATTAGEEAATRKDNQRELDRDICGETAWCCKRYPHLINSQALTMHIWIGPKTRPIELVTSSYMFHNRTEHKSPICYLMVHYQLGGKI